VVTILVKAYWRYLRGDDCNSYTPGLQDNARRFSAFQTQFAASLEALNPRTHAHGMALRVADGGAGWRVYNFSLIDGGRFEGQTRTIVAMAARRGEEI